MKRTFGKQAPVGAHDDSPLQAARTKGTRSRFTQNRTILLHREVPAGGRKARPYEGRWTCGAGPGFIPARSWPGDKKNAVEESLHSGAKKNLPGRRGRAGQAKEGLGEGDIESAYLPSTLIRG